MAWTSPGLNNSLLNSLNASLKKPAAVTTWQPWQAPIAPPAGSYDPTLGHTTVGPDGQLYGSGGLAGQAQRGYDNLTGDVSDLNARDNSELGFTVDGLKRQKGRTLADLLQSRTREGQDYTQATADLGQNYARLATSQAGNAVMSGVAQGGTFAAALAARAANQGHDQTSLDLQHTRFDDDNTMATTRVNEDYGEDDLGAIGQARRQAGYGITDRLSQLGTAGLENQNYQTDLGDQRWYQAGAAGYAPPAKGAAGGQPANEFTSPDGSSYRIVVRGTRRYRQAPDGTEQFLGTRPGALPRATAGTAQRTMGH